MIIEINKDMIPYKFQIDLGGMYEFTIRYNKEHDFFTVDLAKDDKVVARGDKVVYGRPLFSHLKHLDVPKVDIIPYETANTVSRVTFDNMSSKVYLHLSDDYEEV